MAKRLTARRGGGKVVSRAGGNPARIGPVHPPLPTHKRSFPTASTHPLAVVTGASSGIGYHLALLAAEHGHDLVIAADEARIAEVAHDFEAEGAKVLAATHSDLATPEGIDKVEAAIGGRPVAALFANAGHGMGHAFLDQGFKDMQHVINTNIVGTINLVQRVGKTMRSAKAAVSCSRAQLRACSRAHSRRSTMDPRRSSSTSRWRCTTDLKTAA